MMDTSDVAKMEEFKKSFDNRQKYNNELREQRQERIKKEKDIVVQTKFKVIKEKLKKLGLEDGDATIELKENEDGEIDDPKYKKGGPN